MRTTGRYSVFCIILYKHHKIGFNDLALWHESGLKSKKSQWKGSARGFEGFLFDLPVPTRPEKGVQKIELPHPLAEISAVYQNSEMKFA
jgi:hypothetical protein